MYLKIKNPETLETFQQKKKSVFYYSQYEREPFWRYSLELMTFILYSWTTSLKNEKIAKLLMLASMGRPVLGPC